MARRKYDRSNMSTPGGASQFKAHATRKTLEYDIYGARTTFIVRVLTRPIPTSADDFKTVMEASKQDVAMWEVDAQSASRIVFMGRILSDGSDAPSPHSTLPDPCVETSAMSNPGCAAKITSWHTRFWSRSDYNGKVPEIGDKVRVTLSPGEFKYDLQNAYFDNLESVELTGEDKACQTNLSALFKGFDYNDLGEILDMQYADASDPNATFASYQYGAKRGCTPGNKNSNDVETYFGTAMWKKYRDSIASTESGGMYVPPSPNAMFMGTNAQGYAGRYQFGVAALVSTGYMKMSAYQKMKDTAGVCRGGSCKCQHISCAGTVKEILKDSQYWKGTNGINSLTQFLQSESDQDAAFKTFTQRNFRSLRGHVDLDSPRDVAGMLAAAHLGGSGAAKNMRNDNGVRKDANGTAADKYYRLHGGAVCP